MKLRKIKNTLMKREEYTIYIYKMLYNHFGISLKDKKKKILWLHS